jgi:hypothetical protein
MPARSEVARRIRAAAERFERECTAIRIPFRDRLRYWFYYIALARRGVMVHSALADAQYADSFYRRGYDKYCEKINRRLCRAEAPAGTVEMPSFAHGELELAELQLLVRRNIPFVIRDGARALPAKNWSLDYLEQVAGACSVPINEAGDRPAADTSRPTKADSYYQFRTGKVAEVTAAIRAGGNMRITTAEDVMHHDHGRLRQDLDLPWFERLSGWEDNQRHWLRRRLFVGKIVGAQLLVQPPDAFTLWHAEPGDNFFVLAKGVKTWTLAHPYYTAALRPRVKTTTNYHGSNVDIREPDAALAQRGYAGYLKIPKVRVVLQPGDILRVPNHWWHTVVTHPGDYTMGVSIRAIGPPNLTGPGYVVLRLLDRQYHAMARAFAAEGRIRDAHIGYPRKSRTAPVERSRGTSETETDG